MSQHVANASTVVLEPLEVAPLPGDTSIAATGVFRLPAVAGAGVGIWEVAEGVLRGVVAADEVFVVLSGSSGLLFEDTGETVDLVAGDIIALVKGQTVTWTVVETLRKVYVNVR